ncbi:MAG: hypothetical protein C0501_17390 [Isosphaera sp.]|nr:hypothetical protein [Isosphaera sp.]
MLRVLGACAFLWAAGHAAADDKKPDPPKGEAVTGTVALDGQPLPGGTVTFVSKDGKTTAAAPVKDGKYEAKLPAGEYGVGVVGPAPPKVPRPFVPERYGDPQKSGIVVKVAAGRNEVNLDLKSK